MGNEILPPWGDGCSCYDMTTRNATYDAGKKARDSGPAATKDASYNVAMSRSSFEKADVPYPKDLYENDQCLPEDGDLEIFDAAVRDSLNIEDIPTADGTIGIDTNPEDIVEWPIEPDAVEDIINPQDLEDNPEIITTLPACIYSPDSYNDDAAPVVVITGNISSIDLWNQIDDIREQSSNGRVKILVDNWATIETESLLIFECVEITGITPDSVLQINRKPTGHLSLYFSWIHDMEIIDTTPREDFDVSEIASSLFLWSGWLKDLKIAGPTSIIAQSVTIENSSFNVGGYSQYEQRGEVTTLNVSCKEEVGEAFSLINNEFRATQDSLPPADFVRTSCSHSIFIDNDFYLSMGNEGQAVNGISFDHAWYSPFDPSAVNLEIIGNNFYNNIPQGYYALKCTRYDDEGPSFYINLGRAGFSNLQTIEELNSGLNVTTILDGNDVSPNPWTPFPKDCFINIPDPYLIEE